MEITVTFELWMLGAALMLPFGSFLLYGALLIIRHLIFDNDSFDRWTAAFVVSAVLFAGGLFVIFAYVEALKREAREAARIEREST